MERSVFKVSAIAVALGLTAAPANAAPITIISEAKTDVVTSTTNAASSSEDLQEIDRNNAWQQNDPRGRGAVWVSNADTGENGSTFQGRTFTNPSGDSDDDVIFTITETFTVSSRSRIELSVWSDDTARLSFNGVVQKDANFTQGTCAIGSIGCEPNEQFDFIRLLNPGQHTIKLDTYQIGTGTDTTSNPFGILYSGEVTEVSIPATLGMLGVGLIGLATAARRHRNSVA